jgi:uncharacterized membrane protein
MPLSRERNSLMQITYQWVDGLGPVILVRYKKRQFYLCICHHRKDRSIWFFGLEKIFCARCCGIISGLIIGIPLRFLGVTFPISVSLILIIPLIVDGITQLFECRESNNVFRVISGLLFGIGCICVRSIS